MVAFSTVVVDGGIEVSRRLEDFSISIEQLTAVGRVARIWADDASPLMPNNAPGTLAYIYGVSELRHQLLDGVWEVDRTCGVEAVVNRRLNLRIGYQNVDRACDVNFAPLPRSNKGAGSEILCGPNLFEYAGVEAGPLTGVKEDGIPTFYVMVGEDGSVELSQPIISKGTYVGFVERIFIRSGSPDWADEIDPDNSPLTDFDVEISFKAV